MHASLWSLEYSMFTHGGPGLNKNNKNMFKKAMLTQITMYLEINQTA